ncbi:MAG: hypothetical protein ACPL7B_00690 [Candidatus Poribacteria bacterium]
MFKLGVLILTIMLIYGGLYAVISIITPEPIIKGTIYGATGKSLDEARSDGYLKGFTTLCRDAGIFGLSLVILGLYVLYTEFRKGRRWAWIAFLITGCLAWLGGFGISISVMDWMNVLIRLVGAGILLLGLIITAKRVFGKKETTEGSNNVTNN